MTVKNIRLCPANGGYIIKFDMYKKTSMDEYDGERYVCEKKIVVEDGKEAIDMVDKLFSGSAEVLNDMDMGSESYEPKGDLPDGGDTNLMNQE